MERFSQAPRTKPGKNRILSVAIVGKHASDLLAALILPMKHRLELKKVLRAIHNYPTVAEANKITAGNDVAHMRRSAC